MTSGGVASKLGNWYEEAALVPYLLRLLQESIAWLQWEAASDGDGIDFSFGEDGRSVGVQCKHRQNGRITWSDLGGAKPRDVLAYAGAWLDAGPSHIYHLQADATFPEISLCCDAARTIEAIPAWRDRHPQAVAELAARWSLDPGKEPDLARLRDRCSRFYLELEGQSSMERQSRDLARALSPTPEKLLGVLSTESRRHLGRQLTSPMVRRWLKAEECHLHAGHQDPLIGELVSRRTSDFLADIAQARGVLDRLERPETARVLAAVAADGLREVILVHGPPGGGKSEILARCVERWCESGACMLPLRLDRADESDLDEGLPAKLVAYAGGLPLIVVCDQFDTVTWAGGASHPRTTLLARFLRRLWEQAAVHRVSLRLVVGCRSLDAEQDTQLRLLLRAPLALEREARAAVSIAVNPWSMAEVEGALASSGIMPADIDKYVLALARTPIFLRLVLTLRRGRGDLSGIRTVVDLLDAHWKWAQDTWGERSPAARRALDGVVQRMQSSGLMRVPEAEVADTEGMDAVIAAGLLAVAEGDRVRMLVPGHQLFIDAHIARQWASVAVDAKTLLALLGERSRQTLRTAGSLRLAVPRLRRNSAGRSILADVLAGPGVRTLVQVAALRGMSADVPHPDDVPRVVVWLAATELRPRILAHLLRGSPAWVEMIAQDGWFQRTWDAEPESRPSITHVLASVAQAWGDGVADLVRGWTTADPDQIRRMPNLFWHEPANDSVGLFEQRVRAEERRTEPEFPVSWDKLLREHPDRALRLMAVRLPRVSILALTVARSQPWFGFPGRESVVLRDAALSLGESCCFFPSVIASSPSVARPATPSNRPPTRSPSNGSCGRSAPPGSPAGTTVCRTMRFPQRRMSRRDPPSRRSASSLTISQTSARQRWRHRHPIGIATGWLFGLPNWVGIACCPHSLQKGSRRPSAG
jgi:hypothetical protein